MTDATLAHFRNLADALVGAPADWEWVGPHMSQRMFGITQARAEAFARVRASPARRGASWRQSPTK